MAIDGGAAGSSDDTIQIGTSAGCSGVSAVPMYSAWYEVWDIFTCAAGCPITSIPAVAVAPGNILFATIKGTCSSGGFSGTVTLTDQTTGMSFSSSVSIPSGDGAECISANWIVEAPVNVAQPPTMIYKLPNFKSAKFSLAFTKIPLTCYATISGVTGSIESFTTNVKIVMHGFTAPYPVIATRSILNAAGDSFRVKWF